MKDKIVLAATVLLFIFCTSCNSTTTDQADTDMQDTMATMPAASPTGRDSVSGNTPPSMADTSVRKGVADSMPLK